MNACSIRGVVLHGKQSEDSQQKEGRLSGGLEKSHADSVARSCDSFMKDSEKSRARSRKCYMKDPEELW